MKNIYVLGPVAALIAFGAYTWHFNQGYEVEQKAKEAALKAATETRLKHEAELRKKAIEEAMTAQAKLKTERLAREEAELKRKEARQAALDAQTKYYREQEKLGRTVERLKKELRQEEEILAKIEGSIKYQQGEKAFQVEYVKKAQANVAALVDVLKQIEAAEAARAAMAAAEAAKNNT